MANPASKAAFDVVRRMGSSIASPSRPTANITHITLLKKRVPTAAKIAPKARMMMPRTQTVLSADPVTNGFRKPPRFVAAELLATCPAVANCAEPRARAKRGADPTAVRPTEKVIPRLAAKPSEGCRPLDAKT